MSAAYAQVAPSAATSVTVRTSAIVLVSHTKRWRLACDVEEPADKALPIAHGRDVAAQPGVEAKTAASALERKQEHQHGQEHVRPWPLGRIAVEAEPELQRVSDGQHAHEPHRKSEDHRRSERQFGKKDNWPKEPYVGQHDILQERAVELESRAGRFLFGPVLQAVGHR